MSSFTNKTYRLELLIKRYSRKHFLGSHETIWKLIRCQGNRIIISKERVKLISTFICSVFICLLFYFRAYIPPYSGNIFIVISFPCAYVFWCMLRKKRLSFNSESPLLTFVWGFPPFVKKIAIDREDYTVELKPINKGFEVSLLSKGAENIEIKIVKSRSRDRIHPVFAVIRDFFSPKVGDETRS
ncbi:MAG: hypothetical protein KAT56_09245 [Sedimentisphaerales bacterium]|nr:hypothetical protein [Sedimentisphaerales bacterium]